MSAKSVLVELGRFLQPDPKEFGAGDYNLYRYCHNDPVNRSDPFGLDFFPYTGPPIPRDTIKEGAGLGETQVDPRVVLVPQGNGIFTLRLDVHLRGILVAQRAKFHGKMIVRSQDQKDVTFNEHEGTEHRKDWEGFHNDKQKDIPTGRFDKDTAERTAKTLTEKIRSEAFKANEKFQQHQPESRWKDIRDRELPH